MTQLNRMSVNQMLKNKQSKGKINFDKLPKRIMLSCIKPEIADEQGDQEEQYSEEFQQELASDI